MLVKKFRMFFKNFYNVLYHNVRYIFDEDYCNRCKCHERLSKQIDNDEFNLSATNNHADNIILFDRRKQL